MSKVDEIKSKSTLKFVVKEIGRLIDSLSELREVIESYMEIQNDDKTKTASEPEE